MDVKLDAPISSEVISGGYKGRDKTIDIVKGIGISLMVYRHARGPYSEIVLLFHMAIFFVASGYLYNRNYANNMKTVGTYIAKKLKGLWIPYFNYTTLYLLLNNFFIRQNVYTNNSAFLVAGGLESQYVELTEPLGMVDMVKEIAKAVLFRSGTQMGGALWFFQSLFFVLIGYTIMEFAIGRILPDKRDNFILQSIISVTFLGLGFIFSIMNMQLGGLARVLSFYILIHIGVVFKHFNIMQYIYDKFGIVVLVFLSIMVLFIGYHIGYISAVDNDIENPIFFVVMSVSGWILLYSVAKILCRYSRIINKSFAYIGMHSVSIIGMHFLCFKLISYIEVSFYKMDEYMLAAFPVLISSGLWWLAYMIAGITVPLLLNKIFWYFFMKVKRK